MTALEEKIKQSDKLAQELWDVMTAARVTSDVVSAALVAVYVSFLETISDEDMQSAFVSALADELLKLRGLEEEYNQWRKLVRFAGTKQ